MWFLEFVLLLVCVGLLFWPGNLVFWDLYTTEIPVRLVISGDFPCIGGLSCDFGLDWFFVLCELYCGLWVLVFEFGLRLFAVGIRCFAISGMCCLCFVLELVVG